jgi:hypothetical protein
MTKTGTMVFKIEMQNKLHISNIYDGASCRHKVALLLRDHPQPNSSPTPKKHLNYKHSSTLVISNLHMTQSKDRTSSKLIRYSVSTSMSQYYVLYSLEYEFPLT